MPACLADPHLFGLRWLLGISVHEDSGPLPASFISTKEALQKTDEQTEAVGRFEDTLVKQQTEKVGILPSDEAKEAAAANKADPLWRCPAFWM